MKRNSVENTLRLKNVIRQSATALFAEAVCVCMSVCITWCCSLFLDTPRIIHIPTHAQTHTHYVCKYNSSYETGEKREREKRVLFHNIHVMHVCVQ